MDRGYLSVVCLGAILLLPLAAAAPSATQAAPAIPDREATMLHVALLGTGAMEMDPTKATSDRDWAVLDHIYDGLGALDPATGQTIPWLAESWMVTNDPQNTNVSVKIRKGVKFHDNGELNADDVVATFNNAALKNNSRFSAAFKNLQTVAKINAHQVNFVYAAGSGNGQFLSKTLLVPILPDGAPKGNTGSGAFKYSGDGGACGKLDAVEGAWTGLAGFDTLHFMCYDSSKAAGDAMKAKVADVAGFFVGVNDQVNYSADHVKLTVDWGKDFTFIAMNSGSKVGGAMKITQGVRLGIALSVQKYTLTSSNNGIYKGAVLRTSSIVSPSNPSWFVPGLPDTYMPDYDDGTTGGTNIEPEAEELVPAAGAFDSAGAYDVNGDGWRDAPGSVWNSSGNKFDVGGTLTVNFVKPSPTMNGEPRLAVVADIIAGNLVHNGIKTMVTAKDVADLASAVRTGSYDVALLGSEHLGSGFVTGDPSWISDAFRTGGPKNYFGYSDSGMDGWAGKIDIELDQARRAAGVAGAAWNVATKLPVDPLFYTSSITAYNQDKVANLKGSVVYGIWGKLSLFNARPVGAPTALSVSLEATSGLVQAGGIIDVSGSVKDERGIGVEGAAVAWTADGACNATGGSTSGAGGAINANGKADAVTSPMTCTVTASATYRGIPAASSSVTIAVYPVQVKLSVRVTTDSATVKSGSSVSITVSATKVGANGTAAAGATVTLTTGPGLSVTGGSKKPADAAGKATFTAVATSSEPMSVDIMASVEYAGPSGESGMGSGRSSVSITSSKDAAQPINTPGFEALVALAGMTLAFVGAALLGARRRK
jgi:ABC-type transport system substrate-binding protein